MQQKSITLRELSILIGAQLKGDPNGIICGVADLEKATADEASFLANLKYKEHLKKSQAGVVVLNDEMICVPSKNYLIHSSPSEAFQKIIEFFIPKRNSPTGFTNVHPTSVVHPSAKIGENVILGPYSVIDEDVSIGNNTYIGAHVYVGPETSIGNDCKIHPHVVIRERCTIKNHVEIQPGAVIGSCGYGYTTDEQGRHNKLQQLGGVTVQDHAEVGACTTIDRGRFKDTLIGRGTKIDNLVQIAHNVELGSDNLIIAQTGIAGSTSTGSHVILAGQVAVAGHLHLDSGVVVAGKSGVTKSLPKGKYNGIPALPLLQYNQNSVGLRNLAKHIKRINALENEISNLKHLMMNGVFQNSPTETKM